MPNNLSQISDALPTLLNAIALQQFTSDRPFQLQAVQSLLAVSSWRFGAIEWWRLLEE